jgi:integrase
MKPETALDVYKLFKSSPEYLQNPGLDNNLKTALRIALQALDFRAEDLKREQLDVCLGQVLLSQLQQIEALLDTSIDTLRQSGRKLSDGSLRNYRSALTRFMNWLRDQRWYYTPLPREDENRAPAMSVRKSRARRAEDKRQKEETLPFLAWDGLKDVLIDPDQLNPEVLTQLKDYECFWTTTEIGLRKGPPMQPKTIQRSLVAIYFLLGWFNQHQGVKPKKLTLETITQPAEIMVCIDWAVTERQQTYCWASDLVKVAIMVAKFCNPHARNYDYRDIPTVKALRFFLGEIRKLREDVGEYSLQFEQFPDGLKKDWSAFEHFCLEPEVPERKTSPISERTFRNYREAAWGILGWQHNVQGIPVEDLALANVADITVLQGCISYLVNERKTGYGRAVNFAYGAMAVAKWLNPQSKRRNFGDIEQVAEIRDYVGYLRQQHRDEGPRQDLENKRLSFFEAQQVVEYLKQACAPLDKYGDERSQDAIMSSWQAYLIVSILTYCPVRQREIREMTLNSTLFREADGYWVKLKPKQHKAGKKSRKGREYPLPKHLTEDLDHWLDTFRPRVLTDHDLVFMRMGSNRNPATRGEPLNEGDMSELVSGAVQRATAVLFEEPRDTTPHVYRRIAVTFQRRHGRPEQREAFAELMGHTVP